MPRFAHISDCHLGAWRDKTLRKLNLDAFMRTMDECVRRKVDFILICGDLFDKNIPDLDIVEQAASKMREVKTSGIEIYVIYGSHDYSPVATSIIDVLNSAGLFTKIMDVDGEYANDKISLNFIEDKKTGAKIAGLSGRRSSIERRYYEMLDRDKLEREQGFKIFAFHIGVNELMRGSLRTEGCVPLSFFPMGFDYYAGGHIHSRIEKNEKGYGLFVYAGATFGWNYNDLENTANGEVRGFYVVDFGDKIENVEFIEIQQNTVNIFEVDADNKNAEDVKNELEKIAGENKFKDSIALIRIKGTLSTGKQSDVDIQPARDMIYSKGAVNVFINRNALVSKEFDEIKVRHDDRDTIEERIFREHAGSCAAYSMKPLTGEECITTSKAMLSSLREEKKDNETKNDYTERMVSKAANVLKVKT